MLVSIQKDNVNILLGPLSRIINLPFKERLYPERLKIPQVTPVQKASDTRFVVLLTKCFSVVL